MRLRLNLATAPQANHRPFLAATALIGTLGLLALGVLSHAAYNSWQSSRELRADTARLEAQIRAGRQRQQELRSYFHGAAAEEVLDRSAFLNSLIDERSFPWTRIFMDLEQTLPPGVRVVSISPRLVNGRAEVSLQVGTATDDGKIQFLQAIEKSKMFSGLVIKNERRSDQPGAADKIVLDLTVWYSTV
jgi:Tfp pilus assembly protein PilN